MKTYKISTLGCRTNRYESKAYESQLLRTGYREAKEGEKVDLHIVNTCTVTASSDKKSLYAIRRAGKEGGGRLVVTGCMVNRAADTIRAIPGVTDVVANERKADLLASLLPETEWPEFRVERFEGKTRAFLKIQDGCNSYCSYCVIPFVRGRSRSRRLPDILSEAEQLVDNGYREIVLTGINIGDFDGGETKRPVRLSHLVEKLDRIEGLERIRISSIDPDEVDPSLLRAVLSCKKACGSMHIVLQSGSNLILKRMRRKYTRQEFVRATEALRKGDPDFTFTTDVIVGFPGESEGDFAETLRLVREIRFAKVHIFPYSDRPKTRASRMANKVSREVIGERKKRLLRVVDEAAYALRERYVGRTFDILLEGENMGRTTHFIPVVLEKSPTGRRRRPNEIVRAYCKANDEEGLVGEEVSRG
ncbi:MAG: tRNA (N(6)-L-threonylcarbamoyladenosine(37)-C(2))-methylthiotransferase MtaB [Simkaniaceae bacterium]|nr:tRNA (N(6)-L-threonylcarbamoyladenosine(37)-C(2))-methylthiotransferase MtaB [Simkaniaceae bacterium]